MQTHDAILASNLSFEISLSTLGTGGHTLRNRGAAFSTAEAIQNAAPFNGSWLDFRARFGCNGGCERKSNSMFACIAMLISNTC